MRHMYDPACLALAEHFLADDPLGPRARAARADVLAQVIQDAIEGWLATTDDDPVFAASAAREPVPLGVLMSGLQKVLSKELIALICAECRRGLSQAQLAGQEDR